MIKLGLTGGIGSGKSTIAKVFEKLNVPVFYSDIEAKKILFSENVKPILAHNFGLQIFNENNIVDTKLLSKVVFSDKNELQKLNNIIHPALLAEFIRWTHFKENQRFKYVVMEAAILFEAHFEKNMDFTLAVVAPIEERIKRVMHRDGSTYNEVLSRIENQISQEDLIEKCDYIIRNSDQELILPQLIPIHQNLIDRV